MTKKSFASKVKSFLNRGNERKINKFYNSVLSIYKDNIELLKRENKKLEEKIEEAKESKIDFIFNLDLDRINSVDDRLKYVEEYSQNLLDFDNKNIDNLKIQLEENKEKIKTLNSLIIELEKAEPIIEDKTE